MNEIFKQIPLYRFFMFCNETQMEKTILDCGAGGDCPPLSLFADYGYITHGVEYNADQLQVANHFASQRDQSLNIKQGDMRSLEFQDEAFCFVYSYNSVFHMEKTDILASVKEMKRVLRTNGLLFVNFLTTKDFRCGTGVDLGQNQYEQMDDYPVIHSYFAEGEPEQYFEDMEILYKEDRVLERIYEGERIRQGFVDYILRKH